MTDRQGERVPLYRRVWKVIVNEFAPPPKPRPTPSEQEFAAGHHAVGIIYAALEQAVGQDVQGADDLVIRVEIPGQGLLYREVSCPLSSPGQGRDLVGLRIEFRHTTYDPDYRNDVLVTWWPLKVQDALKPISYEGPGALRARIWGFLFGCSFIVMYAGIAFTPILLADIGFGAILGSGPTVLPSLLPGVHPGAALAASISAVPLGLWLAVACSSRQDAARAHATRKEGRFGE